MSIESHRKPSTAIAIQPSQLSGPITVPPSKSLLHRGLFCAALAGDLSFVGQAFLPVKVGQTFLSVESERQAGIPVLLSDDVRVTLTCLETLLAGGSEFFCGESGTTLRLLIPVATTKLCHARFTGAGRLPQRPLSEYRDAFAGHGVTCNDTLPLETHGLLKPGVFRIPGNISSQYISGLLLALPLLDGDSEIVLTSPLESASYVEMTRDVMRHFGVETDNLRVRGKQQYLATKPYVAEPDFSQAAFWLLARHLGHDVVLENVQAKITRLTRLQSNANHDYNLVNPVILAKKSQSLQGDAVFESLLGHVGEIDVSQIPDLVPALAAAASFTDGETRLVNAARLRLKESDRIASTRDMLRAFGVETASDESSLTIHGRAGRVYNACTIDSHRDHRIVMAAAMLATRANGSVAILGADAVNKSYPNFFDHFKHAGGVCS